MPVTVTVPAVLARLVGGRRQITLPGADVSAVMAEMVRRFPAMAMPLLRGGTGLLLNGRPAGGADPVCDGDELACVPAVAGGAVQIPLLGATNGLPPLSNTEIDRYSRHLMLPEVTMEGQRKLKAASVLLIGTGGLGSPLAVYLAAAGVGRIGIVEFDDVSLSNLQRQILYTVQDVGRPKAEAARDRLKAMNPDIRVEVHNERLDRHNALKLFAPYDIIIDGTDNFPTRYLVNDACVLLGKPNVYGSIFRFEGQVSVFWAEQGPCYRCLYPEPPPPGMVPSCAEGGVLGVLPGIVGCLQANEAVKLILGQGEPLIGRLLLFDALPMKFREVRLRKDPGCPICGKNRSITGLIDYEQFCGIRGEESHLAVGVEQLPTVTVKELKARLDAGEKVNILDVREPHEWAISNLDKFGAKLIPLGTLAGRVHELDSSQEYVVHCKMGGRSAKAVQQLMSMGFRKLHNLKGGITAWATEIDPAMAKY